MPRYAQIPILTPKGEEESEKISRDIKDIYDRIKIIEIKLDLIFEYLQLRFDNSPRLQNIEDGIKQGYEEEI